MIEALSPANFWCRALFDKSCAVFNDHRCVRRLAVLDGV